MAKRKPAKKVLRPDQAVQRLSLMLADDPALGVAVQAIYDRTSDTTERLARLQELSALRGRNCHISV